jgi:hypothetical protein
MLQILVNDQAVQSMQGLRLGLVLQPGVFGVVWVVQARAGVRIVGGTLEVRLGASGGPPSGGIFRKLAHFDAAAVGVRFAAAAITSSGRDAAQAARSIGEEAGRRSK